MRACLEEMEEMRVSRGDRMTCRNGFNLLVPLARRRKGIKATKKPAASSVAAAGGLKKAFRSVFVIIRAISVLNGILQDSQSKMNVGGMYSMIKYTSISVYVLIKTVLSSFSSRHPGGIAGRDKPFFLSVCINEFLSHERHERTKSLVYWICNKVRNNTLFMAGRSRGPCILRYSCALRYLLAISGMFEAR